MVEFGLVSRVMSVLILKLNDVEIEIGTGENNVTMGIKITMIAVLILVQLLFYLNMISTNVRIMETGVKLLVV